MQHTRARINFFPRVLRISASRILRNAREKCVFIEMCQIALFLFYGEPARRGKKERNKINMPLHTNVNRFRGRHVFLSREGLIRILFCRFNGEHKS